ncbi:MAG: MASE3 domain-containing protein [bacterium]|nr:MASE3 domain-containing protein [bacterium]
MAFADPTSNMLEEPGIVKGTALNLLLAIIFLFGLYLTSLYNYLLFHSIVELFSVVIAFSIFMFAWNSRRYIDNFYFIFLGIAYLFIGGLDTLHTLSYKGMPIFTDYDYYANQLWIAARYMESISLVVAFAFLNRRVKADALPVFLVYTVTSVLIVSSVFYWKSFPICFVEGEGLTPFKKVSEYVISCILVVAIYLLHKNREHFDKAVFRLLLWSVIFTIFAELAFTFYISNYGLSNLIGHVFKIISFKFIYEAVIATGLTRPYDLLFRDIRKKKEALAEANNTKDKFFSIIAHDLKNPFSTLLGFSGMLIQDYEKFDDKTKKEFIRDIHQSSEHMYDLLENLLTWSVMQTGGMDCETQPINISAIVDESIELLRISADDKEIKLVSSIDDKARVIADVNMMNTVVRNLLSNAIKFTGEGGEVEISSKEQDDFQEIIVSDTGVGISAEDLEKLFRLDVKHTSYGTRKEAGTGLGLLLCKEFIEKNGGAIRAESEQGKGSRFIFTLPLA